MARSPLPWLLALGAVALGVGLWGESHGDAGLTGPDPTCPEESTQLSAGRYLRALSLDLRGVMPSVEELALLDSEQDDAVIDDLVDEWLGSPAFADRVVRRHRDLLWHNVENQQLINYRARFRRDSDIYWRQAVASYYRGGVSVPCDDRPAEFSEEGDIIARFDEATGAWREGWVEVAPYWDPESTIRVCAYDAQENAHAGSGLACDSLDGQLDPDCGCGPDLIYCSYSTHQIRTLEAMAEDVDLRIAANMQADESYLELFTGRRAFVNGPLTHYWKHHSQVPANIRLDSKPLDPARLPELHFTEEDEWREITLPPEHAGILTSPAYLLRYQTDRARANRFFSNFLCEPFSAPDGGLEEVADGSIEPDLQIRPGCDYCHARLEPAAAYWGRWTESGAGYLDPDEYPAVRDDCFQCATTSIGCTSDCNRNYLTNALSTEERPYLGMLHSYVFRNERHYDNVELGPAALVQLGVADGRLPSCVAASTASWLLGREVDESDRQWVEGLAIDFAASDYSYRGLVRSIVRSERYRRVQ